MKNFTRISVAEADVVLANSPNAILLDTRDENAYSYFHHPRAINLTDKTTRALVRNTNKATPLVIYCYHGHSSQDIAQMFCDFGFKQCFSVDGGYAAWQHKITQQFPVSSTLSQWLNERGVDVNNLNARLDEQNRTALMIAAKNGRTDIVHDLIHAGAEPNYCDCRGNNALWYACVAQNTACVKILINADIEIDNTNVFGFSALSYSIGLDDIFNMLVNCFSPSPSLRLGN